MAWIVLILSGAKEAVWDVKVPLLAGIVGCVVGLNLLD